MLPPIVAQSVPGEQAVISALEAPVVNVAMVAVLLSIIAVIVIILFGGHLVRMILASLKGLMESLKQQTDANTKQAETNAENYKVLRQQSDELKELVAELKAGHQIQADQTQVVRETHDAINSHEDKSEERFNQLMEGLKGVSENTEGLKTLKDDLSAAVLDKVGAAIKPLVDDLGKWQTDIEKTQRRQLRAMKRLSEKGAQIQDRILEVIKKTVENIREETAAKPDDVADSGGPVPAAVDDSGSRRHGDPEPTEPSAVHPDAR